MKLLLSIAAVGVTTAIGVSVIGLPLSPTTAVASEASSTTSTTVVAPAAPVAPPLDTAVGAAPPAGSTAPAGAAGGAAPAATPYAGSGAVVTGQGATAPGGLAQGAEGSDVVRLQQRLVALHYDPGTVDGRYGAETAVAVMAFQKVSGLARTGSADAETLVALDGATDPAPLVPGGAASRVEVDMARQVLFVWADGRLVKILPVSTGNGKRYCENGECGVAVTPLGGFKAQRRIPGAHRAPLGVLYNPVYFHQGFAIHGSPSVPAHPASHGCVRIPVHSSRWIYDHVPNGTPIHLL